MKDRLENCIMVKKEGRMGKRQPTELEPATFRSIADPLAAELWSLPAFICITTVHSKHTTTHMKTVFSNTVLDRRYFREDKVVACHRGLQGKGTKTNM